MQHSPLLGTAPAPLLGTAPAPLLADDFAASGLPVRADLGQHFLRSPESARRLLDRAEIPSGAQVLEVGAGLGTLSATIAGAGYRIWAVEKDARLRRPLEKQLGEFGDSARITIADVRRVDLTQGLEAGSTLVSIMPFAPELAAALVRHVFGSPLLVRGLVVMPSLGAEQLADDPASGLRVEEVDGIARADFYPPAPTVLRVVVVERNLPCLK
ncbi:rRNA adenine N-6-methyltransferase family protein [Streptomyces canus]|uniref:rRNA adenine N-6-methyltransferase family protein n=1 Tax=Streptomyces canus TaxID=58343 RepID=UPI0027D8B32D|nr:rRNA adenine N-6-methyltransferase family protein [Streptomyces canus]